METPASSHTPPIATQAPANKRALQQMTQLVNPELAKNSGMIEIPQTDKDKIGVNAVMLAYKKQDPQGFASFKHFLDGMDAVLSPSEGAGLMKESAQRILASMHITTIAADVGFAQAAQNMPKTVEKNPEASPEERMQLAQEQIKKMEEFFSTYHAQIQAMGGVEKAQQQFAFVAENTKKTPNEILEMKVKAITLEVKKMRIEMGSESLLSEQARAGMDEFLQITHYTLNHLKESMPEQPKIETQPPCTIVSEPSYEHQRVVLSQKQEIVRS